MTLTTWWAFSSTWPSFHHVILAGGLEPADWQVICMGLCAESGWPSVGRMLTNSGLTATKHIDTVTNYGSSKPSTKFSVLE